jgi:hypothetical protein
MKLPDAFPTSPKSIVIETQCNSSGLQIAGSPSTPLKSIATQQSKKLTLTQEEIEAIPSTIMDIETLIRLIVEQVMRSSVQFGQAGQARSNLQPCKVS